MKVIIEIPEEFEDDFKKTDYLLLSESRFEDSMNRIKGDLIENFTLSGNYEIETIDMLIEAFKNATAIKSDGGELVKELYNDVNSVYKRGSSFGVKGLRDYLREKFQQEGIGVE